ncbi:Cadherin-like beta sandwich domain-containing protein [Geosporobacter subterraneus DSM 17957]|uniref:Cadherin-like beta sandwich domain-containing protein n=1 Tax=Geosporobacter subterraneus DSM 17957 TaxID=1121919 RepID=A0A1M6LKJ7_9FIRM|nr:chitobiase/beta-hexosaminidase C-terminal domain-containing protein [Geosporobacter subterraneus]SHJ71726.1 Cadherin-like beta sandwich domain-containing protein [Geosporobacter subterraneus DSM 17957]
MLRKALCFILSFLLFFAAVPVVGSGQSYSRKINASFDNLTLYVDGQKVQTAREPFIFEDRIYAAAADLTKALSLQWAYDDKKKSFVLSLPKTVKAVDSTFYSSQLVQRDYQITALQQEIKTLENQKTLFEKNRTPYRDIRSASEMQSYLRDRFDTLKNIPMSISFRHYSGDTYRLNLTFPSDRQSDFEKIPRRDVEDYLNDIFYAVRDLYDRYAKLDGYIRDNRSSSYKTYVTFETSSSQLSFDFTSYSSGSTASGDAKKLKDALDKNLRSYQGVYFYYRVYTADDAIDLTVYFDDEDYYDWSSSRRSDFLDRIRREVMDTLGRKTVNGVLRDDDIGESVLQFRIEDNRVRIIDEGTSSAPKTTAAPETTPTAAPTAISRTLTIWPEDISVQWNQKNIYLSAPPFIYEGERYLPVADIADALYLNYQYLPQDKKIEITTNGVLRGDSDQALIGRLFLKNEEINRLTAKAEELREAVAKIKKLPYPHSGTISSVYNMETYLQDYFGDFEGIDMNISFYRYSGSEYRLRITYDTNDFDSFDRISSTTIESWLEDMFDAIRTLYDPYAEISGSIRNTPYSSVDITYITFTMNNDRTSVDFEDHGTQKGHRFSGSRLQDYLNRNFRRYNSVSLSYEVIVNRKDVDLIATFNHSYYYDWSIYRKMDYLQLLKQKIEDEFGTVNINGRMIDTNGNKEVLRFSFENGSVRSLTLLEDTEKMLNKEKHRFTHNGNTFTFSYSIKEKDVGHFDVTIEGDFSKTDNKWRSVEENAMGSFRSFIQDALRSIQDIWSVRVTGEVIDQNQQTLLTMDLRNTQAAAVNADPAGGALASGTTVTLTSATSGATIYYTLSGSDPTESSTRYTGPLSITGASGETITLKAMAVKAGMENSSIRTFTYTISEPSADLSGLTLSGSPSGYSFSPTVYTYTGVTVANGVSSITLTPTGPGSITVNGQSVASGSPSAAISLSTGVEQLITVVHTESGKAPKTYRIYVTRGSAVNIHLTDVQFTTILGGLFSGRLTGASDYTNYQVSLVSKDESYGKPNNHAAVNSDGTFSISGFDTELLTRLIGYKYVIRDGQGNIVKEGDPETLN